MCGIFGTLGWEPRLTHQELEELTTRLAHRGPDDAGYWQGPGIDLGFRRLAIIDLSPAGNQPLANEDETKWLVFNGEIYNYRELRDRLESKAHVFRSRTDSEVVLHGYEEWGIEVVTKLRGMFAFAIWDGNAQRLFLARDRLGIKPLYYHWDGRRFAFASEIKALVSLPATDLRLDSSALWDYLTYLYVPHPKTVYEHIRQVPPGFLLQIERDSTPQLREYWDVENWGRPFGLENFERARVWDDARETVRAKLTETVEAHLVSDVPIGLFLSGGIDSSTISALAASAMPSPPMSFSIGFDVPQHSELDFARRVARGLHTHHQEEVVSRGGLEEELARMLRIYDQPFGDASAIPTLRVSSLAARRVKVVLSGDGGDEVFGGYKWYRAWTYLEETERLSPRLRRWLYEEIVLKALAPLAGLPKITEAIDGFWLEIRGKQGADRYGAIMSRVRRFQKERLLADLAREFRDYDDYWHFRRYWREDLDSVSRLQYVDLKTYLPDDILTKVDRASMAVSLEVRPPLLDHELVELVASLPSEFRTGKRMLQGIAARWLPEEIITRKKKGFSVPLDDWLSSEKRNGVRLRGLARWAVLCLDTWRTKAA